MSSRDKRKGDYRMIRTKARRILAFMLVLMMLVSTTVFAADVEDVPYYSYCYWEGPSRYEAVPMRAMYEATTQINGDSLGLDKPIESAEHIALSPNYEQLYVLDSGNSRLVVVNTNDYSLNKEVGAIKFADTDYLITRKVQQVKPNTEYVLFWWVMLMEGDGNLQLTVRNTADASVIPFAGNAFNDYGGDEDWTQNVVTFNTGAATEVAFEIDQTSDDYCLYYLDEAFLVERSVLESVTLNYAYQGPITVENMFGDIYGMEATVTVGGNQFVNKYNLILDAFYEDKAIANEAVAAVFSGSSNLYELLTTSDFAYDESMAPYEDGNGAWNFTISANYASDVESVKAELQNSSLMLKKVLLKQTLANLDAVYSNEFGSGLGDWQSGYGAYREVVLNYNLLEREVDDGSMKMESCLNYKSAYGVYVSANNEIYLADTNNYRILVLDGRLTDEFGNENAKFGYLKRVILRPEDPDKTKGIPEDLEFKPTRVIMDDKGYLFVVSDGCFYGMLVYDETEEFLGFHGSYNVETTVLETIEGWITGLFMTNEKNAQSQKKLPAAILDIAIGSDGLLYTLSSGGAGQVKRLGLNGNQTLNHKFGFQTQSGDLVNFSEVPAEYWHEHYQYQIGFQSIAVDPDGFSYVLDMKRGRIFMHDEECRAISAFATGFDMGEQVGTFITPSAITCSDKALYVVDFVTGAVTVFEQTEYGRLFKIANKLTIDGRYEDALDEWIKVLKMDANNQRAYEGIGKAMLAKGNAAKAAGDMELASQYYEVCMEYAEMGNDQQTYSQAFSVMQKEWLTNNFWWIFLLCLALVGGIAALLVLSKKHKLFHIKNDKLRVALTVPFHPFQAFQALKYQKFASTRLGILFLVIFYLASVSEDLYGGFMYVITDVSNYNALYTLIGSVGLVLLWVIANWGICMLNEGKGSLKEIFTMSCYSLTPMILFSVIFLVGSHTIAASETSTFGLIGTIMFIYTALLLLIGMTVVHEYTFFKSMKMAIMTILGMLLTAFVIFSVVLLTQQFITFFVNIFDEIALR